MRDETMEQALIRARDLTRIYQKDGTMGVEALKGVSIDIQRGEFVALVGASGSGKSTLMNLLGCLDRPTSGSVVLDGREVSGLDEDALAQVRSQLVGFVFQSFNLLPGLRRWRTSNCPSSTPTVRIWPARPGLRWRSWASPPTGSTTTRENSQAGSSSA